MNFLLGFSLGLSDMLFRVEAMNDSDCGGREVIPLLFRNVVSPEIEVLRFQKTFNIFDRQVNSQPYWETQRPLRPKVVKGHYRHLVVNGHVQNGMVDD